jgi:D-sedoheptulose 7-phosphate isomerase
LIAELQQLVEEHVQGSIQVKSDTLARCGTLIAAAGERIGHALRTGNKLMLCGNGGSAADSQHIAAEFVSVLTQTNIRPGLPAIALTTDSSILTASANDFGFDGVFERQVQALGRAGDVVMGISTSGQSENVFRALRYAQSHGMFTISLTGEGGGRISSVSDICIAVPSRCTQYVQESHIMIGHIVCAIAERPA